MPMKTTAVTLDNTCPLCGGTHFKVVKTRSCKMVYKGVEFSYFEEYTYCPVTDTEYWTTAQVAENSCRMKNAYGLALMDKPIGELNISSLTGDFGPSTHTEYCLVTGDGQHNYFGDPLEAEKMYLKAMSEFFAGNLPGPRPELLYKAEGATEPWKVKY